MADQSLTQLAAKTTPASGDLFAITDVSDTSMASWGTSKSVTFNNIVNAINVNNLGGFPITVANGGTGQTTLTSGSVLVGNGTSAVSLVATTGSGNVVLATSPTLVTPTLGVASATTINKVTLTAPATGSTLTIADGKTLTVNNTLTLAGTDSTTITFQGTDTYVGRATTDTLTNKTIGDTLNMTTGNITQNGTAAHITLTPGASKLVKTAILEQDITTNNYRNNAVILTGWTFVTGDGATTAFSKAITFGITFTTAPVILVSELGGKAGSDPTTITDHSVTGTSLAAFLVQNTPLSTTGFTMNIYFNSAPGNGTRVLFTWTALGTL